MAEPQSRSLLERVKDAYDRNPPWVWLLAAVGVIAVAAVTISGSTRSSTSAPRDPGRACADFIIAVADAQDGILTDAEFRAEMQAVADAARGTSVEQRARDVLAAVTSGTSDELHRALERLAQPCREAVR